MASSRASIRAIAGPTASFCKQWCHHTAPCRRPEYIGCFHPTTPTVTEDKRASKEMRMPQGFLFVWMSKTTRHDLDHPAFFRGIRRIRLEALSDRTI